MIKLPDEPPKQPEKSEMPVYKTIDKITITKSLFSTLLKYSENATNNQIEGMLFGHEGENDIVIETGLPTVSALQSDQSSHLVL
jgi:hypothetical protein